MVNKVQESGKKNWASKFFKSIVLTGTTLLVLLQPGFSKNNDKVKAAIKETLEQYDAKRYEVQEANKDESKTYTFKQNPEMMNGGNDAFNFAMNNVDKYYPDMKKHLEDMIKQFGTDTERKDAVSTIFDETLMGISDPKQRIWAIIYSLEGYIILVEAKYGNTYDSDISNETFLIMEKAGKKYKIRLNNRLADLAKIEQEIKDMQIEIDKDRAEIVKDRAEIDILDQKLINTLNKISSQDVKTNERIRNLVIETKVLFFKYWTEINPHIDELFTLVP